MSRILMLLAIITLAGVGTTIGLGLNRAAGTQSGASPGSSSIPASVEFCTILGTSNSTQVNSFTSASFSGAAGEKAPDIHGRGQVPGPARIGVYDSRAIAIAYAASRHSDVAAKTKEYQQAKSAGDQEKMKTLDAWGRQRQRELNRQGFARVPVTDLLEPVKDQFPALARKLGVSAIVFECNYIDPKAEKIDVTMELVKLYEPTEMSMKWIAESMKKPPVGLDELNNENP